METPPRLHALDALRAFALLLGIVLHASVAFIPAGITTWPLPDVSTSGLLRELFFLIHLFRMPLFFVMAGFFGQRLLLRGARTFISNRSKRILVPLLVGLLIVMPLTIAVLVWGLSRGNLRPPLPPAPPFGPPVPLIHLWFLYLLCIYYFLALLLRGVRGRPIDALVRAVATRPVAAAALLSLPLTLALLAYPHWIAWEGIPAPAVGLVPNLPALVGYGVAFTAGWQLSRQPETLRSWQRSWLICLTLALVFTIASRSLMQTHPAAPVPELPGVRRLPLALLYSLATWFWTIALIGGALRFCSVARPAVRYLADASYWMYLVHLPLVWGLQVLVTKWPLHWTVKFVGILLLSVSLLLASYHYLVRSTRIGQVLNGHRY